MSLTEYRLLKNDVEKTETFKSLSKTLKRITLSRTQISEIEKAINTCYDCGYRTWEKATYANWRTKAIVKELLNNN